MLQPWGPAFNDERARLQKPKESLSKVFKKGSKRVLKRNFKKSKGLTLEYLRVSGVCQSSAWGQCPNRHCFAPKGALTDS